MENNLKKKNTIGFYCSSIAWGGLEMNTVRYAIWMKESGWNVVVFAVRDSPIYIQTIQSALPTIAVRRNKKYFDIPNAIRIKNLFHANNITICWFRDTRDFSLLGIVKRLASAKFKLLYQQAMQFGVSKKDFLHTVRYRPVDAWVSTLEFLANQVKNQTHFSHDKIFVVPLGVDVARLRIGEDLRGSSREFLKLPTNEFVMGVIGRLDKLKGQHVAIQALKELHLRNHKIHLLIFGELTLHEGNEYEMLLHQMVKDLDLQSFVHFRPFDPNVYLFYQSIDIFIMCSKGETFGTVTIEAMANRKAIVATDSSGTPEILQQGHCGLLFTPGDHQMLAERAESLILDKRLGDELSSAAVKRFEKEYSKEISVRRMEDVLASLLGTKN